MVLKRFVILLILLPSTGNAQIFENIGLSTGINFTALEWEYRLSHGDDLRERESKERGVGFNVYASTGVIEKKHWSINTSLGWIRKNGLFTEPPHWGGSQIRYRMDYLSWINVLKGKFRAADQFVVNAEVGPRVDFLLTPWDDLPYFAPNDDNFHYYHRKSDVRKVNIGLTGGIGLGWDLDKVMLQLSGWRNVNFNPIIGAEGLREDGLGDEGFRYKMRDNTFGVNLHCILSL